MVEQILSEVNYADRKTALTENAQEAFTLRGTISTVFTMSENKKLIDKWHLKQEFLSISISKNAQSPYNRHL